MGAFLMLVGAIEEEKPKSGQENVTAMIGYKSLFSLVWRVSQFRRQLQLSDFAFKLFRASINARLVVSILIRFELAIASPTTWWPARER
jgi:hypothetical protein